MREADVSLPPPCSVIKYKFAKLNFINKLNNREFCFFVNLLVIKRMDIWFDIDPAES